MKRPRRIGTRWLVFAALTTGALAIATALKAQKPSLVIVPRSGTIGVLDTIYGGSATPRVLGGLVAPTTPVVWTTRPTGVIAIVKRDAAGHAVSIAGLAQGTAWAIASWQTFPGTTHLVTCGGKTYVVLDLVTLYDSIPITVTAPTHTLSPFNTILNGAPLFDITLANYCAFPLETDKSGLVYTGRAVTWSTNDTTLARRLNSPPCPDTTVDPAKLPVPLPVPRP